MLPGWARLRSQIRRPRFNHFLSCPRGRAGGSELECWPIRAEEETLLFFQGKQQEPREMK